jgi:hypothetical protein
MCCKQCHLKKSGHFSHLIFEFLGIWKFPLTKWVNKYMPNYLGNLATSIFPKFQLYDLGGRMSKTMAGPDASQGGLAKNRRFFTLVFSAKVKILRGIWKIGFFKFKSVAFSRGGI